MTINLSDYGGGGSGIPEDSQSFSPVLWDASLSDGESQTYTTQIGDYYRIGGLVFFNLDMTVNSLGSLNTSDQAFIGGFPFSSAIANSKACSVGYGNSLNITAGHSVIALLGVSTISLWKWSAAAGVTALTVGEFSAGGRIIVSGSIPI